jgi:hypothetical protein
MRAELGIAIVLALLAGACGRSDPPHLAVSALPVRTVTDAIEARFQLRNAGGLPLALDGVVPACGCVPTAGFAATLAAGDSTILAVHCRAPSGTGPVVRELRLRSSDPGSPETPLRVTLVATEAGPSPAALYLGYVAVGQSAVGDVVLPLAVGERAWSPRSDLSVEPLPVRADGALGVRVRFSPRTPGVVRATLDLGPAGGRLPVSAVAYDRVMAFPAEIRSPRPTGARGLPPLTLVAAGDAPLAIGHIDYPAGMSGEVRTLVPGRQLRLVLRGRSTAHQPDAAIRVYGDGGGEPILTIPVVGTPSRSPT